MAKPYWQNNRRPDQFEPALSNRPTGPRHGDSKVQHVKQGVRGALRAKNLRLLLGAVKAPEDLAAVAEVPLDRLQNMAEGALCSDEMAYHLQQQLSLPTGWLDHPSAVIPNEVHELLANPGQNHVEDEHLPEARPQAMAITVQPPAQVELPTPAQTETVAPAQAGLPFAAQPPSPGTLVAESPPMTSATSSFVASPTVSAPVQLSGTVAVADISITNQVEAPMATPDMRRKNMALLLEGKGAKSALARLISLSPASVTSMLNGTKPLDQEFCNSIGLALQLPENWFETEQPPDGVPEAVQKRLAPLPRGSATPAPVLNKSGTVAAPPAAAASVELPVPRTPSAEPATPAQRGRPTTWPAPGGASKVTKLLRLGTGPAAVTDSAAAATAAVTPAALAHAAVATPPPPAAAPVAAASAPQTRTEPLAAASVAAPASAVAPVRTLPVAQVGDTTPAAVSGFIVEGGLPPITEALIKTLAQKARQGSLSEDRAFELLGSVRAL